MKWVSNLSRLRIAVFLKFFDRWLVVSLSSDRGVLFLPQRKKFCLGGLFQLSAMWNSILIMVELLSGGASPTRKIVQLIAAKLA